MAIITQTDKRTGITYAYETQYHWDKEKKQSRAKRVCVGKVDPVTGDIIPTRGRAKKQEAKSTVTATSGKTGPKPFTITRHLYYGATYLFDRLADELGLTADLKQCFPDTYKKLLSIAYYLILEDNNPLYRFEKWNFTHKHPNIYDDIRMFNNYDDSIATYGYTVSTEWDYTQERPYKGDVIKDKRRMYIHYYYSIEKGADDEQFFEVKTTPKRGRQVYYKEDAIKEARKYLGYFALITNETMDAFTALHLYRICGINSDFTS